MLTGQLAQLLLSIKKLDVSTKAKRNQSVISNRH